MAKILMLTHGPTPDYRIDREAEALAKDGHELYLIYRTQKGKIPSVYKKTFQVPLNNWQRALEPINCRLASRKYKKIIEEIKPNIIHAHDITAANIVRFVLPKNVKFVYDDHEIWEFLRRRQADARKNIIKKIIVRVIQMLTKNINNKIAKKADFLIVINEHWVPYYVEKGVDRDRLFALENFASKYLLKEVEEAKAQIDNFFIEDKRKKIIHSSKLTLSSKVVRDVTNIAEAANNLDNWVLVVFGEPDKEFSTLGVHFIEPKPRMEYLTSCMKCDVALNPLKLDERFHYSSSNRLYEFVSLGIRVMATKAQTYLDKFGDSLIWIDENTTIEEIEEILNNIEKYPSGEKLRKKVEIYNWENESKKLVEKYKKLLI